MRRDFEPLSELSDPDSKIYNRAVMPVQRIMDSTAGNSENKEWLRFLNEARNAVGLDRTVAKEKKKENTGGDKSTQGTESEQPDAEAILRQSSWQQMEWIQLCDKLIALSHGGFPVQDISELEEWIFSESRFTFSLSSISTIAQRATGGK